MSEKQHTSFKDFYPFYLGEHKNKTCRLLHVIGTSLIVVVIFYTVFSKEFKYLISIPFIGYGFAWVGHFVFEKNRPATFTYPLYSFLGDWVMWWQIITFKIKL